MCSSVQYTGVDPRVYMMAEKMRNRAWKAREVASQESKSIWMCLEKFLFYHPLPAGSNFTPFNSSSQEWSSSCDDIQLLGLEALLSNSELII